MQCSLANDAWLRCAGRKALSTRVGGCMHGHVPATTYYSPLDVVNDDEGAAGPGLRSSMIVLDTY